MSEQFEPLLTTVDWNGEWKRLQAARNRFDDAGEWDERAKTFPVKHGDQSGYVEQFLALADVLPGETVLDMGCGTGALATPLATAGCHVIACDFSQGMLDKMVADQTQLGVTGVETRLMSWSDDWDSLGLGEGCVDIALASRSIATNDLRDSLMKLDRVARRRTCVTLPSGPSPRTDERLLAAAGFEQQVGRDFLYAFNILASCGINPEVAYISSVRAELFDTFEDACESYDSIVGSAVRGLASPAEIASIPQRLNSWLEKNLVCDERGWHLPEDRTITWAFVSWNTRP